ncbi:phage tail tube protein [Clostridium tyrobutyricum]|uniref:phage tail tube protein n=1 Tax=Clostridium tyrobutyricum TaxID=1519 RepID=UPI001C38E384|nr:phage tail tube protein [Clostridium tyrobutyricum]MBV4417471.1 phage tail tube protein [Clostridium tyrobutyricum]
MEKNVQQLNGKNVKLFVNGQRVANLSKVSIQIKAKTSDITQCGEGATGTNILGYSISGTMTLNKTNSYLMTTVLKGFKDAPDDIEMMGVMTDPKTQQSERLVINGVVFTEWDFTGEAQKENTQDYPFNAYDFEPAESID